MHLTATRFYNLPRGMSREREPYLDKGQRSMRPMIVHEYEVKPRSISIDEATVYAQIELERPENCWRVVIAITRASHSDPMDGREVEARLTTAKGTALEVLARPSNVLV